MVGFDAGRLDTTHHLLYRDFPDQDDLYWAWP